MFIQILISTGVLVVLAVGWLFVQRLAYHDTACPSGDYLEGRWGCGDCAISGECELKRKIVKNGGG